MPFKEINEGTNYCEACERDNIGFNNGLFKHNCGKQNIDSKTKEQTDYLFNQIEPYLSSRHNYIEIKDIRKIIYKILKVFNKAGDIKNIRKIFAYRL